MLRENVPVMFTIHFAVSARPSPSLKANHPDGSSLLSQLAEEFSWCADGGLQLLL